MKKKILVLAAMAAMGLTVIADHTTPTDPGGQEKPECTLTNKYRAIEWNDRATYKYDCQCDQGGYGMGLLDCE
jgi:hypothetical protein